MQKLFEIEFFWQYIKTNIYYLILYTIGQQLVKYLNSVGIKYPQKTFDKRSLGWHTPYMQGCDICCALFLFILSKGAVLKTALLCIWR